ncbi:TetR/AcrR family transcriptional regulator [Paramicrobacterium chengjingii]|uniref:TetR/AcrR family transcriptional regulator C-terminal domain-containing protein n=1 Tax=Paramicrobacterium chengjingii TaxID=2769067 RepID=A0ABX6YJC9_9MICO|nr:TetR/AcrR family transcriptional regulator C-terminal domain-containing protein [Microbacterium chengjingii]QPZ38460.1 TetR/AcrR family transcriptional regulator C-terminal domain-containing protein [Microbacterium chengjingii]
MTDPDAASRADAAALLWGAPGAVVKRGPKPRFTLEAVVDAARQIADEDGLSHVTMQSVADRLGAAKMALYRYVPGRAELDAVMLDTAFGNPDGLDAGSWREALSAWTLALYHRALQHPWVVELAGRPHTPGPAEIGWYEAGLEALSSLPLAEADKLDALALLSGHALSMAHRAADAQNTEELLAVRLHPHLTANAHRFPRTAAAFAASSSGDRGHALQFGIDRIIDGLAAHA